jgi:hypothetical protein
MTRIRTPPPRPLRGQSHSGSMKAAIELAKEIIEDP